MQYLLTFKLKWQRILIHVFIIIIVRYVKKVVSNFSKTWRKSKYNDKLTCSLVAYNIFLIANKSSITHFHINLKQTDWFVANIFVQILFKDLMVLVYSSFAKNNLRFIYTPYLSSQLSIYQQREDITILFFEVVTESDLQATHFVHSGIFTWLCFYNASSVS